jgi:succinyl-diaminopimelate desuccinylase
MSRGRPAGGRRGAVVTAAYGRTVDEILAWAQDLIAIRSTADRPADLHRALELALTVAGPGFTVRRFESNGKPSALVHPAGSPGPFRVILNAHLDVVPGEPEQFRPRRDGDRLYGRGAQDMKLAAVVLATVFREVAPGLPVPVALQLVTDEEVGGFDGTAHQIAAGVRGDFVLIGEQSGLRVVTECKGIARIRMAATGRAAHGAYPWLGDNALTKVVEAAGRVTRRYPVPDSEAWTTTVNLGRIDTTGTAVNQVPAAATAWLDVRFPPEDPIDGILATLRDVAGCDVRLHLDSVGAPVRVDPARREVELLRGDGELLRKHGAADSRFYAERGVDAVIFGPGGDGQHGPDEYADLRTVVPYRNALIRFLHGLR